MIQRRRSPDGTNRDIAHGPGPVGVNKPRVSVRNPVGGTMALYGMRNPNMDLSLPPTGWTAVQWNKGPRRETA